MDILDFYRGKYSVRKLIMWIRHLPSDSALAARGYAGDDRWGMTEHLMATAVDYLQLIDHHYLKSKGVKNLGEIKLVTRPDMTLRL